MSPGHPSGSLVRSLEPKGRLIVALDVSSLEEARALVRLLAAEVGLFKVGYRLFLVGGMPFVDELREQGHQVFLDLKMNDIGETVATALELLRGRAAMLTLFGDPSAVEAAVRGRGEAKEPKLLSVTMLSSHNEHDLGEALGAAGSELPTRLLNEYVLHRARRALRAGCDGWIASGETILLLRKEFGAGPLIVSPGIRPSGAGSDDHKRLATPGQAIRWGADYLVVGRPIRNAPDPVASARAVVAEIEHALNDQA